MPRHYFNASYDKAHLDREGQILADERAAWREDTRVAAELISDLDGDLEPSEHWRLEVTDSAKPPAATNVAFSNSATAPRICRISFAVGVA